jgi:hypothetical protein
VTELEIELHQVRVLAVATVARRRGIMSSERRINQLLHSGLSLDATLRRLDEQGFLSKLLGKLWARHRHSH